MYMKPIALALILTNGPAIAWASPADEFTARLNGFHADRCNGVVASELQSRNIDAGEVRSLTYDWKLNSWKSAWIHFGGQAGSLVIDLNKDTCDVRQVYVHG